MPAQRSKDHAWFANSFNNGHLHEADAGSGCHQVEEFRNRIDFMGNSGDVTQTLAGLQEILVKRRMKRSRDPDDRFVCEILVIDSRVGRQGMILRKRGNQLIVPDTAHFEALSIGRQFDDSRLDRSFEEQFDLSRRIGAAQRESRSWHPLGKRGLDSEDGRNQGL